MFQVVVFLAVVPALFASSDSFLRSYCESCHQGAKPAGGFAVPHAAEDSRWTRVALRVRNMEMPPKGAPAPPLDEREHFLKNIETTMHDQACFSGLAAGPAP